MEPKTTSNSYSKGTNATISTPKTRLRTRGKRKIKDSAEPNEAAFQHLREVVYHKLKMWDASIAAENLLGRDISTGESIDDFCACIGDAEDAMKLTESELKEFFELWRA